MLEEDLLALKSPSKEDIADVLETYHAKVILSVFKPQILTHGKGGVTEKLEVDEYYSL